MGIYFEFSDENKKAKTDNKLNIEVRDARIVRLYV